MSTPRGVEQSSTVRLAAGPSRIGLIVPSSNSTMETELPELFRRQSEATGHRYTFHSARAALKNVTPAELAAMVAKAADCATSVSDADVDVIAYACLVAVMAQGPGPTPAPRRSSRRPPRPTATRRLSPAAPAPWCAPFNTWARAGWQW